MFGNSVQGFLMLQLQRVNETSDQLTYWTWRHSETSGRGTAAELISGCALVVASLTDGHVNQLIKHNTPDRYTLITSQGLSPAKLPAATAELFTVQVTPRFYTVITMYLTLWHPLLPYWYSYKASCARPG